MTPTTLTRAAAVALLALTLSACASAPTDAGTEPTAAAPVEAQPSQANPADPIAFTAIDLETGEKLDGSLFKGKDTIVWFWASWCTVCAAESGAILNAMAEPDFPADVTFVGVAGLSDPDLARGFIDEYGVGGFQHVYDTDGSIWQSFGVTAQPAFAYINHDGTMKVSQGGIGKWDVLEKAQELAAN